LVHEESN